MRNALDEAELGGEFGLELQLFVDIIPDNLTIRHTESVVQAQHQTAMERVEQQLRKLQNTHERENIREWTAHFQSALENGEISVMAQMLARNPDDLSRIHALLKSEQREARQDSMELIGRLIDGNMLETWQLGDRAQAVVDFLRTGTQRAVDSAGNTTAETLRAGGGAQQSPRPFWETTATQMPPHDGEPPRPGPDQPSGQ
ncbi:hypothetical protein QCN29_03585 [Streptomyces sp. HNM0663]|uniref:Uncharacterized protein n=1 Tax=Streptomyces chengmaiensis TaxID=3040919 RepID=A0ABT6HGJ0_9ACTN|nr:hypothetical protein [Streptomyces chengmaiensis]MDH2387883.1 hypothetical protein [Streptomyces chengmaiensis]